MLDFALQYQTVLQAITGNIDLDLCQYELDWEEWRNACQLHDVLKVCHIFLLFTIGFNCYSKVFKDVTMFFSQGQLNINSFIPAMDYLDQQLTTGALNTRYSEAIKAMISVGKKTLNQYYDMTDQSEIYCIAMGKFIVHPCVVLYSCFSFSVASPP
jgi:hypothetical protein